MSVPFPSIPQSLTIQLVCSLGIYVIRAAGFGNKPFLLRGEKDVAMGTNGDMFLVFLFQASVHPTFIMKRVQIINVILRCEWWPSLVIIFRCYDPGAGSLLETDPILKRKLEFHKISRVSRNRTLPVPSNEYEGRR